MQKGGPELQALEVKAEEGINVASDNLEQTLKSRLGEIKIDLLINNAGILEYNELHDPDLASIRRQFDVNAVGPLRVASALSENMCSPSKLAFITSRMGSIEDNTSGGRYGIERRSAHSTCLRSRFR